MKIKKPSIGFYLLAFALVCAVIAFILHFVGYGPLGYSERLVVAMTVLALWAIICLMISSLLWGNSSIVTDVFYVLAGFALTLALLKFVQPVISPLGIYFTVNMGDMDAIRAGVPPCIAAAAFYFLSVISVIVAAFFNVSSGKAEAKSTVKEVAE